MATLERKIAFRRFNIPILLLAAVGMLAVCNLRKTEESTVPYYNEASFTPVWNVDKEKAAKMHKVAAFRMTNQSGQVITHDNLKGKITLVNFFFTACQSVCPKMKDTMKKVQANFSGDQKVSFLSYSVTPDKDNVNKLAEYALANKIPAKQWNLLTGDKTKIYELARKSYFIEEEIGLSKSSKQFLHTENLVLIDGDGHIRGLYNGTLETEVPRITQDINELLATM
ncbi:MAG: SCO family protein [Bacteroidota bacterium]